MLEWKFRLVILLATAGMIAAALGNLGLVRNFSW